MARVPHSLTSLEPLWLLQIVQVFHSFEISHLSPEVQHFCAQHNSNCYSKVKTDTSISCLCCDLNMLRCSSSHQTSQTVYLSIFDALSPHGNTPKGMAMAEMSLAFPIAALPFLPVPSLQYSPILLIHSTGNLPLIPSPSILLSYNP